jgi:hypothetical protein
VGRAKQSIAVLYLKRAYNDKAALEKAMVIFQEFADGSREKEDTAWGLGGEAIVLAFRHEPRESMKKVGELTTLLREQCNAEQRQRFYASPMWEYVTSVVRNNNKAIAEKEREEFKEVLESVSAGEAAAQAESTESKK